VTNEASDDDRDAATGGGDTGDDGGGDDDGDGDEGETRGGDDGDGGGRGERRQRGDDGRGRGERRRRQWRDGDEKAEGRARGEGKAEPPHACGDGPVGVLGGKRWAGGYAGPPCRALAPALSALPVGDSTDFGKGFALLADGITLQSLCQRARAPHAYFAAPVRGRRAVSSVPFGGVRQKARIVGYTYCSPAAPTGPSP
jgi:hypothetical protein